MRKLGDWYHNSPQSPPEPDYLTLSLVCDSIVAGIGLIILVHSFFLHGRRFDVVRICTDSAAIAGILTGAFTAAIYLCGAYKDAYSPTFVILDTLFSNGILSAVFSVADAYMFLSRLKAIRKRMPVLEECVLHLYIWIVLVWSWLSAYTIVPFFCDTNTGDYATALEIGFEISSWLTAPFNFYFTFQSCYILFRIIYTRVDVSNQYQDMAAGSRGDGSKDAFSDSSLGNGNGSSAPIQHPPIDCVLQRPAALSRVGPSDIGSFEEYRDRVVVFSRGVSKATENDGARGGFVNRFRNLPLAHKKLAIVAIKSIGHALTSSFANLYYSYGGSMGYFMWDKIILLGLHLWFNWPLERYLCPSLMKDKDIAQQSIPREAREMVMILVKQYRKEAEERQQRENRVSEVRSRS
jgi:hypothetical protein